MNKVQRQCIELRKQGLTYSAIGAQLKITKGTVAGYIYRAQKQEEKDERSAWGTPNSSNDTGSDTNIRPLLPTKAIR